MGSIMMAQIKYTPKECWNFKFAVDDETDIKMTTICATNRTNARYQQQQQQQQKDW
jgi:hypothetical protein